MPRTTWKPDPTFYPSPTLAAAGPTERLAYVATFWRGEGEPQPDALAVVDVDSSSDDYGRVVGWTPMPNVGDELHHHGWNACSSALCPSNPHPHVERRYLLLMGLRSSRIHFVDVKDDPRNPRVAKVIEPDDYQKSTGYSRPHTAHCGPEGIYVTNLGSAFSDDGPGGIALLDHDSFEIKGQWEADRGDQYLAYDFWWHINHDVLVASEWGTPAMIEEGVIPEKLLNNEYGHRLHFFDLRTRKLTQTIDLGADQQMVLELRPAHDPTKQYGFASVVVSTADLSATIWLWHRTGDRFEATKVISIPAEPCEDTELLPDLLKGFGAVPPLVTDIDLSLDDRFLYVYCFASPVPKQET